MSSTVIFDDIIFKLQKSGGISTYWHELTSRIKNCASIQFRNINGNTLSRFFPVYLKSNLFHSSFYRINLHPSSKNVVTVHDFLYELRILKSFTSKLAIAQRCIAYNQADALICISENTKKDLIGFYPHLAKHPNIHVIHHATSFNYNSHVFPSARLLDLNDAGCKDFVLFVGGRLSYKKFDQALISFAKSELSKLDFSFVCTGSPLTNFERRSIEKLGLAGKVHVVEAASRSEILYLYRKAFALVYPSLYEGFGLPPLEAMSCGCPVIASNTSSIPEVVSDAGILVDVHNTLSISDALNKLLNDSIRHEYIIRGLDRAKLFSWDSTVAKYLQVYQSLLA